MERERFQRRASEGEAVAAAREDAATAARALRAAQAEVERLQSGRARLQDEKEELEEALRGARADLMAAHAQVSKATEELTDEVSKVRCTPHTPPRVQGACPERYTCVVEAGSVALLPTSPLLAC